MLALATFFAAYALIISEEAIRLRKSKPMMVAAVFPCCFYPQRRDERLARIAKTSFRRNAPDVDSKYMEETMPIRPSYDIYRNL